MQNYKEINGNDYVKDSRTTINETMRSIQSMNSGTAFPTTNLFEGMKCYRTDLKKTYTLTDVENNTWVEDAHAELADEATHAASATKLQAPRALNLSGAVTADATSFDGTADATINVKTLDATKLNGTASVSTTGNAATATKLATPRTLSLTGKATGSATFDGSADAAINVTSVNADTASKLSTARKINITGNASGSAAFDGTSDVNINVSVSQAAHADKATADANGRDFTDTNAYMHISALADSTDFNNVKTTGIYYCTGSTYPNRPHNSWGILTVYSIGTVKQEYRPDNAAVYYTREYNNTNWTAWSKVNAANADTATSATTAGNVSNKIYYSSDSPSVATDKLFTVKQAHAGEDNVPNNGLVIQSGPTGANYNGKLYITDNGVDGVWVGGVAAGKEVGWTRLVENKGSWNINSATATKLQTPRAISLTGNASGSANFDGSGNVSINTTVNESKHAAAATTVNATAPNGGAADLAFGTMAANDYARIRVYGKDDNGALEIATADGGNEPIYARQYSGSYDWPNGRPGTVTNEAAILDSNGNTKFPKNVTAANFVGHLTGNADSATKLANNGNRNDIANGAKALSGLSVYQCYLNTGYPQQYGNVVSIGGTGDNELFLGWADDSRLLYRAKRDTESNWESWRAIAFTDEINNYAPTKTGGGASGTWGINISGTATNATKWNGIIDDHTTENNTSTWIPVFLGGKMQHTDRTKMTVGNANTVDGYHASDILNRITAANTGGIVAASLTENGYVKFANGLILQWGITDDNGKATFPIVFTKPMQVVTNIASGDEASHNNFDDDIDDSLTTTGFKCRYFKHRYICIGI